jgi:hypothetical protein
MDNFKNDNVNVEYNFPFKTSYFKKSQLWEFIMDASIEHDHIMNEVHSHDVMVHP